MSKSLFDPQSLPVESIAGEPPVPSERLSLEWLRSRFRNPPAWTPEENERLWQRREMEPVPASVLMPIVARENGLTLLLTRRTDHLHDHAGQVSLPGGRVDPGDADAVATALRETEEEVGLHPRHLEVLGTLPDYLTGTGFRVTPVVALARPPFELQADTFEVAEIFEVPLAFLMDGTNHQRRRTVLPDGHPRTFYTMPYQHYFIWGATAAMVRNLYHLLRA